MSTDTRVWSSLHESLSDGQQSSLLFEIFGLLQSRSRALIAPLNGNFDKSGRIRGLFGFHYFKPSFNGFFDISDGFFVSLSLRKTSGERRHFGYIIAGLIFFYDYIHFHLFSFSRYALTKPYHMHNFYVKKHRGEHTPSPCQTDGRPSIQTAGKQALSRGDKRGMIYE
jgi:hypothetical protein